MTPKEVLALIREKEVKAVDLRFMDFPGTWKHFTIPAALKHTIAVSRGDRPLSCDTAAIAVKYGDSGPNARQQPALGGAYAGTLLLGHIKRMDIASGLAHDARIGRDCV